MANKPLGGANGQMHLSSLTKSKLSQSHNMVIGNMRPSDISDPASCFLDLTWRSAI